MKLLNRIKIESMKRYGNGRERKYSDILKQEKDQVIGICINNIKLRDIEFLYKSIYLCIFLIYQVMLKIIVLVVFNY